MCVAGRLKDAASDLLVRLNADVGQANVASDWVRERERACHHRRRVLSDANKAVAFVEWLEPAKGLSSLRLEAKKSIDRASERISRTRAHFVRL